MSALIETLAPGPEVAEDAFAGRRRLARAALMRHGFPDLKTEAWKYTPLKLLEKRAIADVPPAEGVRPEFPFEATVLHFDQGRLDAGAVELPEGIRLEPLAPAHEPEPDYGGREGAFAWLNLAHFEAGWRIVVCGRQERPLVLAVTTGEDFAGAVHPRIRLELEAGASLVLVEHHADRGAGLLNSVLDIGLGEDARLIHAASRSGRDSVQVERTTASLARGAQYRHFVFDRGGRLNRSDVNVRLESADARGEIDGLVLADSRQHVDYHTSIEHLTGHTHSRESFRFLAGGTGVGVFNGRIYIAPNADDSHSDLNTANLLLSDTARVNTKPELEIHAEEVTASHGATVGQLDEDAIFYLRSRGLPADDAAALLQYGFAAAPLEGLDHKAVRDWLLTQLKSSL